MWRHRLNRDDSTARDKVGRDLNSEIWCSRHPWCPFGIVRHFQSLFLVVIGNFIYTSIADIITVVVISNVHFRLLMIMIISAHKVKANRHFTPGGISFICGHTATKMTEIERIGGVSFIHSFMGFFMQKTMELSRRAVDPCMKR